MQSRFFNADNMYSSYLCKMPRSDEIQNDIVLSLQDMSSKKSDRL